jgi:hypothetical protein
LPGVLAAAEFRQVFALDSAISLKSKLSKMIKKQEQFFIALLTFVGCAIPA